MLADRTARQRAGDTLYKAETSQKPQVFSFYDWKCPLIPVLVSASPHSPLDKGIQILYSVRSCEQLTLKLLWYCWVKGWPEGKALLFVSGSWDRVLKKSSFIPSAAVQSWQQLPQISFPNFPEPIFRAPQQGGVSLGWSELLGLYED